MTLSSNFREEQRYNCFIRFQDANATYEIRNTVWQVRLGNRRVWHIHRTSTLEFKVSFPTLFLATHRYLPLSVLLIFVIVNRLLPCEKLILELLFMGDPSFTQDIDGSGFPVALQERVIFSPCMGVFLSGWMVIKGSSVWKSSRNCLMWYLVSLLIVTFVFSTKGLTEIEYASSYNL